MNTARPPHRLAAITAALAALALLPACLSEPFRGSDVVLELGTQNAGDIASRSDGHYELFAVINEGLVSVGRFTVNRQLDALAVPTGEKIGVANRLSPDGLLQSGIVFVTPANLADADELLLSIEPNGETDPGLNGLIVGRAPLVSGRRSVLVGAVTGAVPALTGGAVPLVDSHVAVVLNEDEVDD